MKRNYLNKSKMGIKALLAGLFLFGTSLIHAQCLANFNYSVGPNGSVSFVSTSTGTIASTLYNWTIQGSPAGNGATTTHTFSTNGYKTFCLNITNSVTAFCTNTKCDSVLITNASSTVTPCNANFSYVLGANGLVSFASTSTGTSVSTNYSWSFGWGAPNASGISTTRTYTANGYDVVCLTITNSVTSCTSTKCDSVFITNVTPTTTPCNANYSYLFGPNGSVSFVSTSTGTSASTNYLWNFGGSSTATGISSTYTYTANGPKTVCLTMTNLVTSCTSTKCDTLFISNVGGSVTPCAPTVVYTLSKDSTMALTWNAYPYYPSNVTNATWYWGDGSSTTGLYPSHTYSAAGTYSTCVTVSVSCGTVTATYCYVAAIFRSSESNDMILVNVKQAVPTGIKNQTKSEAQLSIYPNPNSGEFVLELSGIINESKENTLSIYNMMGQKVLEKQIFSTNKQTIDVTNLVNGTYLVKVNSETGSLHKKITIQK
jgi:PKD repeat protein